MLIAILSILVNIVYFVVLNFIKKYGQNTPSSKVGDECPFFNCEK